MLHFARAVRARQNSGDDTIVRGHHNAVQTRIPAILVRSVVRQPGTSTRTPHAPTPGLVEATGNLLLREGEVWRTTWSTGHGHGRRQDPFSARKTDLALGVQPLIRHAGQKGATLRQDAAGQTRPRASCNLFLGLFHTIYFTLDSSRTCLGNQAPCLCLFEAAPATFMPICIAHPPPPWSVGSADPELVLALPIT